VGNKSAAWIVALFYGVATTFYTPKMLAANTEIFTMLPISAAMLLGLPDESSHRRGFLSMYVAGLLIGVATVVRQLAGLNLLMLCGLPLFWQGRSWSERLAASFISALGFVTIAGSLVYFFFSQGTLHEFWFWTISVVTQRYLPAGWVLYLPRHQLGVLADTVVFWTLLALRARKWHGLSSGEKALWAWLVLSLVIVLFPGRFNPHYAIQAFAPLAILSAIEFRQRLDEASDPRHWQFIRWSTGLLAALTIVYSIVALWWEPFAPSFFSRSPPYYLRVARYVRETTTASDRIFVWGAYTPIYVMSDRLPASRFVAFKRGCDRSNRSPFGDCWDSGPEMWPRLARDLAANSPTLIVDTAAANLGDFGVYPIKSFPLLRDLLATHYSQERTINGVIIYRRLPSGAHGPRPA
jgi:hypothetical protein